MDTITKRYFTEEGVFSFLAEMANRGPAGSKSIAKAMGNISERQVRNVLGGHPLGRKLVAGMIKLNFTIERIEQMTSEIPRDKQSQPFETFEVPFLKKHDLKNVITSSTVSERLRTLIDVPSVLEIVCSTESQFFAKDHQKDVPHSPEVGHNHFFGLSVVFCIDHVEKGREILFNSRQPVKGTPANVHTQGYSILVAGSFSRGLGFNSPRLPQDIDPWLQEVLIGHKTGGISKADITADRLYSGNRPHLLGIISYKVVPPTNIPFTISPLGFVTRDETQENGKRIYTQAVFVMTIKPPESTPISAILGQFTFKNFNLAPAPRNTTPVDLFSFQKDGKMRFNFLDAKIWEVLENTPICFPDGVKNTAIFSKDIKVFDSKALAALNHCTVESED